MIKPYHIYLKHICFSKDHPLVACNEDCAISSKLSSLFLSNLWQFLIFHEWWNQRFRTSYWPFFTRWVAMFTHTLYIGQRINGSILK